MDQILIEKYNLLQDQCRILQEDTIDLPQLVVVGSQSSGKSSVLEGLVQRSFLPRGTGIVTRCPLVLQLQTCSLTDKRRCPEKGTDAVEEWGEFLHDNKRIFKIEEIEREIGKQTEILAGMTKNITKKPITLKIFSPKVPNLTLIDTPGITRVPVDGQPDDIEKQTSDLVREFIQNPYSIILAVTPGNQDLATTDGLKLAREVDPEGERTLAVVTKLDLIPEGTEKDARAVLSGRIVKAKLGTVGVVCRSQKDILNEKSLEDALRAEQKFLHDCFPELRHRHGMPYLSKHLTSVLVRHIKAHLPDVQAKVYDKIRECRSELEMYGNIVPDADKKKYLSRVLSDFALKFSSSLQAGHLDIDSLILVGGAKICRIFSELRKEFSKDAPTEEYCLEQVIMAIRNSNGPRPPFYLSEPAFEALAKPLIRDLLEPSIECVQDVMDELRNICNSSFPKDVSVRYPNIVAEVTLIVDGLIEKCSEKTKDMVRHTIDIEDHVTYVHFKVFKEKLAGEQQQGAYQEPLTVAALPFKPSPHYLRERRAKVGPSDYTELDELLMLDQQDIDHVQLLGDMLDHYYALVADKVADNVTKTVMRYLVNEVSSTLQAALTDRVFQEDVLDALFKEDDAVTLLRAEAVAKLKVLQEVKKVLDVIATS